jgi:3-hydroxyethyl bacteriochlorophyllide a dehydrogenase
MDLRGKAVVFPEAGEVVVQEIDLPPMGPEDVLVRTEYSMISAGTERWCLQGCIQMGPDRLIEFPFITGYQAAGMVQEIGHRVEDLRPGDRVFSPRTNLTPQWQGSWGGHVSHHIAPARSVIKLPESVSTRAASGLVLAQVGYNGAMRPRLKRGDVAIVIGDGLVGQYASQVLRYRGARVIMAGHHDHRLKLALAHSVDEAINSRDRDFFGWVHTEYPRGVPIAVETASKITLVKEAIDALEYAGQLVVLGYYPSGECLLDIHWARRAETTVYFPNSWTHERLLATLQLLEGKRIKSEELITHIFSYQEAPEAYAMIQDKQTDFLGVVLRWQPP